MSMLILATRGYVASHVGTSPCAATWPHVATRGHVKFTLGSSYFAFSHWVGLGSPGGITTCLQFEPALP